MNDRIYKTPEDKVLRAFLLFSFTRSKYLLRIFKVNIKEV
ncbi:hypothetical protein CUS_7538 [Ruminococcus albus 8]|uniref:Uncharacterized protein n=1 Tax=Ruminococcus albus 8 TaxID=246199 RepID=E9SH10_RUMAL|nr:hypothetical protein CUS_7538 [Ruminococcus albus 8]